MSDIGVQVSNEKREATYFRHGLNGFSHSYGLTQNLFCLGCP